MIKLFITICILSWGACLSSQEPFYIIEDFGHIQAKANGLIEYEGLLYVVGSCIPESDTTFRQDLLVSKFDLNGYLINDLVFSHEVPLGVWNAATDQSISIKDGDLIISHKIQGNIWDAITILDSSLTDVRFLDTFFISKDFVINAQSHLLYDQSHLIFSLSNTPRLNLLGHYDLNESKFTYIDFTNDSDLYSYPAVVLQHNDLVFFLSGVQYEDEQKNWIQDIKLIVLDKQFNLLDERYLNKDIFGPNDFIHALVNDKDHLVITSGQQNGLKRRPVSFAADLEDYSVQWQEFHGDSTYKRRFDFPQSLIITHDRVGYLTVGYKHTDPDSGGPFIAQVTKLDSVGKTIWQKSIADLHEGTGLSFDDVVATSDGYYVACGSRSDVTENDGYDSRVQLFMIKFDEEGNIVDRNVSAVEEEKLYSETLVKVYPNPTSGLLYIENLSGQSLSYNLSDQQGRSVSQLKQDVSAELSILDLSGYASGVYVLTARDAVGQVVVSEQVVVN